jgi:hypothetical protein
MSKKKLTLYENRIEELETIDEIQYSLIPASKVLVERMTRTTQRREKLTRIFGFAIPTMEVLHRIKSFSPILEVGAGTGYWSYELRELGTEVIATDLNVKEKRYRFNNQWTDIEEMDAVTAIKKYPNHTLLMVWPCYDKDWAAQALKTYQGNTMIYVGEGHGGCTANDQFYRMLDEFWDVEYIEIPQWEHIRDVVYFATRKQKGKCYV